jgi:hypothetical protein
MRESGVSRASSHTGSRMHSSTNPTNPSHTLIGLTCFQRRNMAIRFKHHRNRSIPPSPLPHPPKLTPPRPNMARIPRHRCPRLHYDILRHRTQRRNRRNPPRPLPRPRPRILGLLGLLHCHYITRHSRRFLVRHSEHERRKCHARHDWRDLAIFLDFAQHDS